MLEEGQKAPAFALEGSDGKKHSLKEYAGKPVVIYFYPKDNTPGCTREACAFTENLAAFKKVGAPVVGVSPDTVKVHQGFIEKQSLSILLLADTEKKMANDWGVFREKTLYGKKMMGIVRSTFIVDGKGIIRKVFNAVKVDGHVEKVLEALKELGA